MSIHGYIYRQLIRSPARVAIVDDRKSYKAYEVLFGAQHIARHLRSSNRSDTLGLLMPNSGGFPMTALAGWTNGKTVVPLNFMLKQEELQYVIDDCGTDTVVTVGPMLDFLGYRPEVKDLVLLDEVAKGFKGLPMPTVPDRFRGEDVATLLYTSGTSGKPKGVMLTHSNIVSNIKQCIEHASFTTSDRILGVLPSFHSFGFTVLTMLPLVERAQAIYSARFVPKQLVELIRAHRPTVLVAIPSMYSGLARVKDLTPDDFSSFRLMASGGEPLPDAVRVLYEDRFGVRLNEGYGLTETSPVTNLCIPKEFRPHSVGRALPKVDLRIVDPDSNVVRGVGEDGEIRFKGPNVMKGYYKLPEETAKVFDDDGYFRTGDIGRLDDDGHLHITGRLKEMMIVGGENVFPREIEEVLVAHPSVGAAGVVGKHDPKRGETPVAFVEVEEGAAFDEGELIRHCQGGLAQYKVPREIRPMEALPRNPTGKVMRRELAAIVAGEADATREGAAA